MLKSIILGYKYKIGLKKNLISANYNFAGASTVGIIYNTNLHLKYSVKNLIQLLKNENKEVHSIGFHDKDGDIPLGAFSAKQFNILGSLKPHQHLDEFLSKKYDLVICIDESNHEVINYILVKTKSQFKVGIFENKDFSKKFDMIVKCDLANDKSEALLKYLKLVESNE